MKWTVGSHCCTGLCIFFQDGSNAISPSVPVGSETLKMKKALGDANTARWLPQPPFPGAQDGQNLISWRWSLPLPKNPVWWGSMHAISSYRGNRATNTPTNTNTQTHTHTHKSQTGPITIHCVAKLSAQCNQITLLLVVKSQSLYAVAWRRHVTTSTSVAVLIVDPVSFQFFDLR